jgi:hypothetical protein
VTPVLEYRRKQNTTIRAIQWDGTDATFERIQRWTGPHAVKRAPHPAKTLLSVDTGTTGIAHADIGDWIAMDVAGGVYPIGESVFGQLWEPVPTFSVTAAGGAVFEPNEIVKVPPTREVCGDH